MFWSIKHSGEVRSKLPRSFRATSLSTYDFSTLYTTLPHNLIKEKLVDLIERAFKKFYKNEGTLYLLVTIGKHFSLLQTIEVIHFGLVRMYVTHYRIFWIIFISDLVISYTDKLLVFRWVQIVPFFCILCQICHFVKEIKEIMLYHFY